MAGERRREDRGRGLPRPARPGSDGAAAKEDPTIDGFAPRRDDPGPPRSRLEGGGTLERLYAGGPPRIDPRSTELPPLPPLSSDDAPRENTWPIPEREETTLAEDPHGPRKPRRLPDELPESFDEVPPGLGDPIDGLLGPIDEFTLSMGTDPAALAAAEDRADAEVSEEREPPLPPRRTPAPAQGRSAPAQARSAPPPPAPPRPSATPPPASARQRDRRSSSAPPVVDPLTTGVVSVPGELLRGEMPPLPPPSPSRPPRLSDATAALVLDGLDEMVPAEPSLGLPEVEMPPPDTSRARGWAAPSGPPAISVDPFRGGTEEPSADDVEVMEASPAVAAQATPPPAAPRPDRLAPRSQAPTRARPEPRPESSRPAGTHPATSAVAMSPRQARPPEPPPPREAPPVVGGLDQLLSLADEPPEREETIGASLQLLRLVDAPPEREETIGASLERLEPPPVPQHVRPRTDTPSAAPPRARTPAPPPEAARPPPPAPLQPLPSVFDDSPVGEETLSGVLEPVSGEAPALGSMDTRPITSHEAGMLPGQPPPGHRPLQSAQLRRQTWKPPGTPDTPPPASRRGPPTPPPPSAPARPEKQAPPPSESPEEGGSPLQDPLVIGAASVIALIVLVGVWVVLFFVLAWIV